MGNQECAAGMDRTVKSMQGIYLLNCPPYHFITAIPHEVIIKYSSASTNIIFVMPILGCPCYAIIFEAIVWDIVLDYLRVVSSILSIPIHALSWQQHCSNLFIFCVLLASQSHSNSRRNLVDPQHQQGGRRKIHLLR